MRRRELITLLGGAAVVPMFGPRAARAQKPAMPVVGILGSGAQAATASVLPLFMAALGEQGFREGRNVRFEYRSADGRYDRLPALAADLVAQKVALIFAMGDSPWAARDVTKTIPIVFANGSDPVGAGLVARLNRPGGNVTGATWTSNPLVPKRMQMLRDLIPKIEVIGALVNPRNPSAAIDIQALQSAAGSLGLQFELFSASDVDALNRAFAAMPERKIDALVVGADSFFQARLREIVALTTRYRLPASYTAKAYAVAGGLMSYTAGREDAFRLAGSYAGRILKGEKPGDLPVQLPTRFELVINLKTARALGLTLPPTLLAVADEVIE